MLAKGFFNMAFKNWFSRNESGLNNAMPIESATSCSRFSLVMAAESGRIYAACVCTGKVMLLSFFFAVESFCAYSVVHQKKTIKKQQMVNRIIYPANNAAKLPYYLVVLKCYGLFLR